MIKFGTDGWRAIMADEFTFSNLRKVAKAIAYYIVTHKLQKKPLIIGYDSRFLSDKFAEEVAKVAEYAGISCLFCERDTPTPVVAWSIKDRKACGAVMMTASHNPYKYNGIKFIPHYAGPAGEEITKELERNSNRDVDLPPAAKRGTTVRFEPRERYISYLSSLIDFNIIEQRGLSVVCDPMFGSGREYLDLILERHKCRTEEIHGYRDVLFAGGNPEPEDKRLGELKKKVVELSADLGLANDGDADRFGIVDEKGVFYSANHIIPLLLDYLVTERGLRGVVVRSLGTTHMIDAVAKLHNIKVYETPIGFKYIAKIMMREDVIIGGEESGGLSILGHIPEKDGILANLLVCEMVSRKNKPLSEIWKELVKKIGKYELLREKIKLSEERKNELLDELTEDPPKKIAGIKVKETKFIDGAKFYLEDGSYLLVRPSGTEPLIRIYGESRSKETLLKIKEYVKSLL